MLALENIEQIVQNSNDLEAMCSELLASLFRAQNKFEKEEFFDLKWKGLVAIIV